MISVPAPRTSLGVSRALRGLWSCLACAPLSWREHSLRQEIRILKDIQDKECQEQASISRMDRTYFPVYTTCKYFITTNSSINSYFSTSINILCTLLWFPSMLSCGIPISSVVLITDTSVPAFVRWVLYTHSLCRVYLALQHGFLKACNTI